MIKVEYLGHSCFRLLCGSSSIVLDPYKMEDMPNLSTSANRVLASHSHFDHNYVEAVTLLPESEPFAFSIRTVDSFHDDQGGAQRGANKIAVLDAEGMRIVHLGDLGHELSVAQLEALGNVDLLMLPVGGFFTIDADTAYRVMRAVRPRIVIPMHYRIREDSKLPIDDVNKFLNLCSDDSLKITKIGNSFELNADTPEQIIVMNSGL